jgi:hypothetical protein
MRRQLELAVAAVCAYEALAILTGRFPTITTLCGRFPPLRAVIEGGLAAHLAPLEGR